MPPKKEPKQSKKEKKKAKALAEAMAKQEEEHAKERADAFEEESQKRDMVALAQRLEIAESKLEKNRQWAQFMVEKKTHMQLQQRFTDLSKSSSTEKQALEKGISSMNRTKEQLEQELQDLHIQHKQQLEDLAAERKRLEAEMSERGNCFVCPDCSKSVYKMIRTTGLAAQLLRREADKQQFSLK
eukprot:NODE_6135_length_876_cov_178.978752_g5904_i0.p1 GENE.NODE_6135_length_876_cov_178.978752_g5904_i0~~NODE_6135_length_876_cov_178.978752_g5904_i0.p1  ORF type:complete len:185 (-),score=66.47 NODE_6135_length_876_cov_178.978752_g5904_i0:177-731(-)